MKFGHRGLVLNILCIVMVLCITPSRVISGDGVGEKITAVIVGPEYRETDNERRLTNCIRQALENTTSPIRVMPLDEFRKGLYPWFQPSTLQTSLEKMSQLMKTPIVKNKIQQLGVRFLITWRGYTINQKLKGPILCGAGYGGGGCLGLAYGDRETSLAANLWDLQEGQAAGSAEAAKQGTTVVPAFILPIPLIARTESPACQDLANLIEQLVQRATLPNPADTRQTPENEVDAQQQVQ